jgi:methylglyoxal synthase
MTPFSRLEGPLALISHDGKKPEMAAFARRHAERLRKLKLVATSGTGKLVQEQTGLDVERVLSGPLGGDAVIASRVARGEVAAVIFLVDPLNPHPHDPDIQGLLRVCNVHNVPVATNIATADILIATLTD